jgi:hypothetical protein
MGLGALAKSLLTGDSATWVDKVALSLSGCVFMVLYPFDVLRAVSLVEPFTMNGKRYGHETHCPFTLRYRRVNEN